ncbi:MAG: PIN domain-containing protein [Thermoanaerobaculia bacterium]
MGFLLDASILIEHERGRLDLDGRVRDRKAGSGHEGVFLSVVTASEILHGVHRARDAASRGRRAAWAEAVIARFPVLALDLAAGRAHARLWAHLAAEGRLIGPHDLWLAAVALSRGLTLVTANLRELGRVPGLLVEDWS